MRVQRKPFAGVLHPPPFTLYPVFVMLILMNPDQQPSQNPYDFIFNPQQPNSPQRMGGGSFKSRLLIIAGGGILLIIIASIIGAVLSSAGKADVNALKDIVARQEELVRVASLGADQAQSTQIRSLAYTTMYSVTTQKQKLTQYLATQGITLNEVELASRKKSSVDQELESAGANNRFDDAFSKILNESLADYNNSMQSAYQSVTGEKSKEVLAESYKSSATLLGVK